jgi:hypothetical protein
MSVDSLVAVPAALSLELVAPVPSEIPVGAGVVLQVRVLGAARDLRGGRIEVVTGEEVIATAELTACRDGFNETAAFAITAPFRVGAFSWTIRFPPQEIDGIAYAESALPISSQTRPHRTSLAVWAVPSPVRMTDGFTITLGAMSSGGCGLGGANVEIRDETGAPVGKGILGDMPWPGSDALCWTEVALAGPSREGLHCWSVVFAATDVELPHLGSSAEFGFTVVKRPQHSVAVTVTESDVAIPVKETQIALGPYRTATDKSGMAHIEVSTGTYDLAVWKSGFGAASKTIEIAADMSVQFELTRLPQELTAWD